MCEEDDNYTRETMQAHRDMKYALAEPALLLIIVSISQIYQVPSN